MTLAAGARVGAYEVVALLGAGGMGEVYRARDRKLQREVAVKILPELFALDPERRARFEREAQVLAALNHPHIAAIYGFEDGGSASAIVMELIDGPTLADRIARGPMPIAEALAIAQQIAMALDAAHEKGIVHRDLKPGNIKLTADGSVKVLDFGLAKALSADAATIDLTHSPTGAIAGTRAGVILGTAAYMSPEQARGLSVDRRTDLWAFGCVLYELLTAGKAFPGSTSSDVVASILTRDPDWDALPTHTPPALRRLLRRCLEKDPKRRLRDAADVQLEIEEAKQTIDTDSAASTHPAQGEVRIWRTVAFAAMAVTIAGALFVVAFMSRDSADPASRTAHAFVMQLTDHGGTEVDGAIAPDGRSFVYVSDHDGTPDLWVRQVSGGNPVRLTSDSAEEAHPVFAPDGETIYFTRLDRGVASIWRVAAFGGPAQKVAEPARMPAPSPDGKSIAYLSSPAPSDLVVAALDGSGVRVVQRQVPAGVGTERPRWSPDGRMISYNHWQLFGPSNLWVVTVASGEARRVTNFTGSGEGIGSHAWLPDNRHVVISSQPVWAGIVGYGTLEILDTITGTLTRLTIRITQDLSSLSVSADGTRLLATVAQGRSEVWKVPADGDAGANGRGAVRVLDSTYGAGWIFGSRDGSTLLFSERGRNLWTMRLDRAERPVQITAPGERGAFHSSLSPDGSRVAFVSSAAGPSDVWVQHVDGSGLRQLTRDAAPDSWPVWTPDGKWIVFGSLRDGSAGTWRIRPDGSGSEKVIGGFFRGDLIDPPGGTGTLLVTSSQAEEHTVRLIDVDSRRVLWQKQIAGVAFSLPVFSADGQKISLPVQESRDRDVIWVLDTATGDHRVAVRFDEPFDVDFRANWVDNGKAFIVNRRQETSHIVLFDRFWSR
jgi:Tol biopolymer transport system component